MPNVAPGIYTITAQATDSDGFVVTSAPVTMMVVAEGTAGNGGTGTGGTGSGGG